MGLTIKHKRFIEEYIKDSNAVQAYMRAGYTQNYECARRASSKLMQNPDIKAELDKIGNDVSVRTGINAEWVLLNLKSITERCMQSEAVLDKDGKQTGEYRFDSTGANKALDTIGKSIGMFKDSKDVNVVMTIEQMLEKLDE